MPTRKKLLVATESYLNGSPPTVTAWSALTKLCKAKGWSYHTLKMKEMPFMHEGYYIDRVKING